MTLPASCWSGARTSPCFCRRLEKRELLKREGDEKDKRVLRLALTGEGEELLMQALKVHTALIEKAMSQSSPAECDMLGEQMRRVADVLKMD